MGIYPEYERRFVVNGSGGSQSWLEVEKTPGLERARRVVTGPWYELKRDNCFCCSCGERQGSDPYCRNHGWAGLRPCEYHNMPGGKTDEDEMPLSVQRVRELHQKARENAEQLRSGSPEVPADPVGPQV